MNNIDFVFPYVDCNDKIWEKSYIEKRRELDLSTKIDPVRYRSWDNLKYLFRGIAKFMPWIRNVYMIVSNIEQVPDWVNQEKVKIVLHKDFIPKEFLPTFNSCTIEMFLKDIPGLSDKFIYGNDDCFPIYPMTEKDFFDGKKIVLNTKKDKGQNTQYKIVEYETEKLAATLNGKKVEDPNKSFIKIQHSINPIQKETAEKLFKEAGERIYNSITPFRDEKNYNQYIYSYYEYFSENINNIDQKYNYYSITRGNLYKIYNCITDQTNNIVCLNDVKKLSDEEFEECKSKIIDAFEIILHERCKYEKDYNEKEIEDNFFIRKEDGKLIFEIPFENYDEESLIINLIRTALNKKNKIEKVEKKGYDIEIADFNSNIKVKDLKLDYYTKDEVEKILNKFGCKCPKEMAIKKDIEGLYVDNY